VQHDALVGGEHVIRERHPILLVSALAVDPRRP
jgi:hypothetical protein